MDQRTRTQLPALPALVRAVKRNHMAVEELLRLAQSAPADTQFRATETELRRGRLRRGGERSGALVNVSEADTPNATSIQDFLWSLSVDLRGPDARESRFKIGSVKQACSCAQEVP